jgi:hypothetical protein
MQKTTPVTLGILAFLASAPAGALPDSTSVPYRSPMPNFSDLYIVDGGSPCTDCGTTVVSCSSASHRVVSLVSWKCGGAGLRAPEGILNHGYYVELRCDKDSLNAIYDGGWIAVTCEK